MTKEADLPKECFETSGLETMDGVTFWTHNDSGHDPMLFALNSSGKIIHKLTVKGATNIDWEDLAFDEEGFLYIADIGNNLNNRRNLAIYKIKPTLDSSEVVIREKIRFDYKDQAGYPPSKRDMRFDAEAIVVHSDSIYLFTKNRTDPYNHMIYCYSFPAKEGHYLPGLRATYDIGSGSKFKTWITAADYDHEHKDLYLLSSDKFWIFEQSDADSIFTSNPIKMRLGSFSQKEGLAVDNERRLWITDEVFKLIGGNLYSYKPHRD